VPNSSYQEKKASVIVFPARVDRLPVRRWKSAGSVIAFPARHASTNVSGVAALVRNAIKAVVGWLKVWGPKSNRGPANLPGRKSVARQSSQPGSRTAGH
jgi:hypothetical protein